jgi:hypothetical protein
MVLVIVVVIVILFFLATIIYDSMELFEIQNDWRRRMIASSLVPAAAPPLRVVQQLANSPPKVKFSNVLEYDCTEYIIYGVYI